MALTLTDDQTALRDSARDFLSEQSPVKALRQLRDSADADGFSRPLWAQFAEMGYAGVLVPEAHGGLGLGHVDAGVVMDQIGHQLCASPLLASGIVATTALTLAGSAAQQAAWLPRLAAAQAIATLAVDEAGKHRPQQLATTARADGDGWLLDGAKVLVLDGHVADLFIVAARVGDAGTGLFLVPAGTPGVQVERTVMVDAHNAARVRFQAVRLGADALLGTVESGAATLAATLDAGRCAAAAELLGLADEVFARTMDYIKQRKQFGKLIGEFQGLQHRAATLYADLEISRAARRPAGAGHRAHGQRARLLRRRRCARVRHAQGRPGAHATQRDPRARRRHQAGGGRHRRRVPGRRAGTGAGLPLPRGPARRLSSACPR
jgi:acyl-CoA dehydrogenase